MDSSEAMRSHVQQVPAAALSKDTKLFNVNSICTTDDDRWIVKENSNNKRYKHSQIMFDIDHSCDQTFKKDEIGDKTASKGFNNKETSKYGHSLDDLVSPSIERSDDINNLVTNSLSESTNNRFNKVHALTSYGTKKPVIRTNSAGELTSYGVGNVSSCLSDASELQKKEWQKPEVSEIYHSSKSSSPSSLVNWQGSFECLLENESVRLPSTFAEVLPKDTMVDRVLRCFEPLNALNSCEPLQSQVENYPTVKQAVKRNPAKDYWKVHHPGTDNWMPDLFFKDFSLEERQFPESEQGSICSAADQYRFSNEVSLSSLDLHDMSPAVSRTPSCTSLDLHTARYVADLSSPIVSDEELILTPPEEFRGTGEAGGACDSVKQVSEFENRIDDFEVSFQGDEGSSSKCETVESLKPANDTLEERDPKPPDILESKGKFRLITESEYLRTIECLKEDSITSLQNKVDDSTTMASPDCSLTNLEHPLRAAYLRNLLLENQEPNDSSTQSMEIEEDIHISSGNNITDGETSLQKHTFLISSVEHENVKPCDISRSSNSGISVENKNSSMFKVIQSHNYFSNKYNEDSANLCKTSDQVTEEKHEKIVYEENLKKTEILSSFTKERDVTCLQPVAPKMILEMRTESASSSGSSGTPPPVDFATHPFSAFDLLPKISSGSSTKPSVDPLVSRTASGNSIKKDSCSLSSETKGILLNKMYPDTDSDSDDVDDALKDSEKDTTRSNESGESEEVELFINNPESMVISQINIQPELDASKGVPHANILAQLDTHKSVLETGTEFEAEASEAVSDANVQPEFSKSSTLPHTNIQQVSSEIASQSNVQPEPDTYEALLVQLECRKNSPKDSEILKPKLEDIMDTSNISPLPSPCADGWRVGAPPVVSEELLNLEGEDFVNYLGTIVNSEAAQPCKATVTKVSLACETEKDQNVNQSKEMKDIKDCTTSELKFDSHDMNSYSQIHTTDFMSSSGKGESHCQNKETVAHSSPQEKSFSSLIKEASTSLKTTRPFFLTREEPSDIKKEIHNDPPFFQVKNSVQSFHSSAYVFVGDSSKKNNKPDSTNGNSNHLAKKSIDSHNKLAIYKVDSNIALPPRSKKMKPTFQRSKSVEGSCNSKHKNSSHVTLDIKLDSHKKSGNPNVLKSFEEVPLHTAEKDTSSSLNKSNFSTKLPGDEHAADQPREHYPSSSCRMYDGASDSSSSSPATESAPARPWDKKDFIKNTDDEEKLEVFYPSDSSQKTQLDKSVEKAKLDNASPCDRSDVKIVNRNSKHTCTLVNSKISYGSLSEEKDEEEVERRDVSQKYRVTNEDEELEKYAGPDLTSVEGERCRNLIGTFDFSERVSPHDLHVRASEEQPDSFGDSFVSVEGGITSLATFNFVGRDVSPSELSFVKNVPKGEDMPSLSESLVSLEDGKHLVGVFDFTKSSDNTPRIAISDWEVPNKTPIYKNENMEANILDNESPEKTEKREIIDSDGDRDLALAISNPDRTDTGITAEDFASIETISSKYLAKEEGEPTTPSLPTSSSEEDPASLSIGLLDEGHVGTLPQEGVASEKGERVVEVYGGVATHPHTSVHAHTSQPVSGSGRSGHGDPARPQPVDPAHLTSLDLESDHPSHEMLVTDIPHPAHSRHPHDLNHNNQVFSQKPADERNHVSGRAAKYLVNDTSNFRGQDNYAYDPGYSSERSPEEEEGPPLYYRKAQKDRENRSLNGEGYSHDRQSLRVGPGEILTTKELMKLFPFISEGTIFEVTIIKNLRGLGLALTGGIECDMPFAGLVRIKKLYPQTPAWLCGQLQIGDIVLRANDHHLTGLSSHEALEFLRTSGQEVNLEVCRPPEGAFGDGEDTLDGGSSQMIVTTSLTAPNTSHNYLSPSPSFSTCGEFEVELTKVAGSLGFTLRKQDNSILGHTIRTLVKEPAISDGRLRPGDKIISVNNTDMCSLSHEEAIAFLRTCPDTVTLKLYRDAMQTPVSPISPTEPEIMVKPKALRKEARDMLTDLAIRKQSPSNSPSLAGATNSPGTPRRRRLQKTPSPDIKSVVVDRWDSLVRRTEESLPGSPTLDSKLSLNSIRETDHETSPFGDSQTDDSGSTTIRSRNSSSVSSCSLTPSTSESSRPKRPSFLDLSSGHSCPRKTQFTPPHEVDQSFPSPLGAQYPSADSIDSAPQLTSTHSDTPAFSHLQQGYHSVNLGALHPHEDSRLTNTTSDHNISGHDTDGPTNNGLLKWKGIVFTPEEEDSSNSDESLRDDGSTSSQKSQKPKVVTIELNRGWNSRLGFSLQPKGERTIITAIYADSVAAKDGRLRIGDIVVKVNDVDVVGWECESIIDLLRKTRGKISLSVIQHPC